MDNDPKKQETSKTRVKKVNILTKNLDEETIHHNRLIKLRILEEDEDIVKEDEPDSDYEMEEVDETLQKNKENRKKTRSKLNKTTTNAKKSNKFGKINLTKYFVYEKNSINHDFPNYHSIIVKTNKKNAYKLCNVCYGFADYTCPRCCDKYCSVGCYKTHTEVKCVKYLDM